MPKDADPKLWAKALAIHKKAIVVDGHNVVPDVHDVLVTFNFGFRYARLDSAPCRRFIMPGEPRKSTLDHIAARGAGSNH